jgi:hypothetical protein
VRSGSAVERCTPEPALLKYLGVGENEEEKMEADEIRKHWNVKGEYPPEMMSDFALIEIAAQLSEMNGFLQRIADAVETKRG